jgi:rfaE bifunctional protein kinase chain/domain
MRTRLAERVARFAGRRVVVVGDLIADEYLHGKPSRISREAPVLILRFVGREVRLGGAANAAHNVQALGAQALPIGVLGRDGAGEEVAHLLRRAGMDASGIVTADDRPTPVKTRIMAGGYQSTRQQVVRLDREPDEDIRPAVESRLLAELERVGPRAEAFVVSDYGYRTVTPRLFETMLELSRRSGAPVVVDSRYDLLRFRGATAAAPNEPEVEALTGHELTDGPSVEKAGRALLSQLDVRWLVITRGSRGMAVFEREGPATFLPIHGSDQIADVTGAGDTVIGTFTVALAAGAGPVEAARLANIAGGVVVMKRGTATVSGPEILQAVAADGAPADP